MKRACIIKPALKLSPYERELDRLIDLRANGWITANEYKRDVAAVHRAIIQGRDQ